MRAPAPPARIPQPASLARQAAVRLECTAARAARGSTLRPRPSQPPCCLLPARRVQVVSTSTYSWFGCGNDPFDEDAESDAVPDTVRGWVSSRRRCACSGLLNRARPALPQPRTLHVQVAANPADYGECEAPAPNSVRPGAGATVASKVGANVVRTFTCGKEGHSAKVTFYSLDDPTITLGALLGWGSTGLPADALRALRPGLAWSLSAAVGRLAPTQSHHPCGMPPAPHLTPRRHRCGLDRPAGARGG